MEELKLRQLAAASSCVLLLLLSTLMVGCKNPLGESNIDDDFNPGDKTVDDTTSPSLLSISASANGTYNLSQEIVFTITFNEIVTVTGSPRLQLNVAGATRYAVYNSGSATSSLVFSYDTQTGDLDSDGISFDSTSISLNSGSITDPSSNFAELNFTSFAPTISAIKVDAVTPTILAVTPPSPAVLNSGDNLDYSIQFSEPVTVTSTPRISFSVGAITKYATYLSGSGTDTLLFRNTLSATDFDLDGIITQQNIDINSGAISDGAGNSSSLTTGSIDTTSVYISPNAFNVWLDAFDSSTLWQNSDCSAGASPVAATSNSDPVGCWENKSGVANHFVQTTSGKEPTVATNALNSQPVLNFDGSDDLLKASGVFSGAETSASVIMLFRDTGSTISFTSPFYFNTVGAPNGGGFGLTADAGPTNYFLWVENWWLNMVGTSIVNVSSYSILSGVWNSGTMELWINGVSKGTTAYASAMGSKASEARIGAFDDGANGGNMTGDIAEFFTLDTGLSTTDREKMEGYLACKWGVQSVLPGGHTYKSSCP